MKYNGINNLVIRFWISVFITLIILFLNRIFHETILSHYIDWMQFFLVTIVILCIWPILQSGFFSIIKRKLNIYTPITLSITFIYIYNTLKLIMSDFFLSTDYMFNNALNCESIAFISTLVLMEKVLELEVSQKIGNSFKSKDSSSSIQETVNIIIHYFVPAMLLLAFLTYVVWIFFRFDNAGINGLSSAITILIVSCPLALNIAVSIPMNAGMAWGKKFGILFKNASSIEQLEKINIILVDNTEMPLIPPTLIKMLHNQGIQVVLTKHASTTSDVENEEPQDIDAIETTTTVEQKIALLKRLQKQGFFVATLNNNHLTEADFYISNSINTSANVTLVNNDLYNIIHASQLSKKVMNTIRQNLSFIFIFNIICLPIATGIFYPLTDLTIGPILGAILMSLSSILVMVNAGRVCNTRYDHAVIELDVAE